MWSDCFLLFCLTVKCEWDVLCGSHLPPLLWVSTLFPNPSSLRCFEYKHLFFHLEVFYLQSDPDTSTLLLRFVPQTKQLMWVVEKSKQHKPVLPFQVESVRYVFSSRSLTFILQSEEMFVKWGHLGRLSLLQGASSGLGFGLAQGYPDSTQCLDKGSPTLKAQSGPCRVSRGPTWPVLTSIRCNSLFWTTSRCLGICGTLCDYIIPHDMCN